jgi:FtsP/CotA-like multicopper oxidase with cupredoxin domain
MMRVIALAIALATGQSAPASRVPTSCGDLAVSLRCAELVPVPSLRDASGVLDLHAPSTPFGVAVTVDGVPRHVPMVTLAGLPRPSTLGPYSTYVAWATSLAFGDEVRLGEVHNGTTRLRELAMLQFRVLITAEASAAPSRRSGPLVLRGTSPSARRLAHRDVLSPAAPGTVRGETSGPGGVDHAAHAAHSAVPAASGSVWRMPPMGGLPMMPGMAAHRPSVDAYLPGAADLSRVPLARPREVKSLADGDVLELDARPVRRTIGGRTFLMFGFNGQYPGPLIRVTQRSTVRVRFTNHLEMPTAVHWHGLRLDNRSDGVPGVTQDPIAPGATFEYTLTFPDAGIYWYHPHVREDIQQDLGLAGNILVSPAGGDGYGPVNREEIVILDDILMDDTGVLPYGRQAPTHALSGRTGNVFLVNGEPDYHVSVRRHDVVRFFLTNASSARTYNLSFGGARMKVLGSDVGRFEHEAWVTSVVLAPAERYIVDVQFSSPGVTAVVNAVQALNHMAGSFFSERHTLGRVTVDERAATPDLSAAFATLRRNVDVAAEISRYRDAFARPVDRELHLTMRGAGLPEAVRAMLQGSTVPVEWNDGMPMENWLATGREVTWTLLEPATRRENMDVAWRFRVGDVVKIRLFNDPASAHPMSHPIHIHGQRFLVQERNGVANDHLVWKDTTVIAAGETVDLLLELSNPGRWMIHCHVAEHLGTGMMSVFQVDPK